MADSDESEDGYLAVEHAVEDSGLEWTHVRPGEFAANWLDWAASIRNERVVRRPYGGAVTQPTHEADVAAVAATAIVEDGHAGRRYTLAGPEALTTLAQVRAIGAAIHEEIRFEELAPIEARTQWVRDGYPEGFVDWIFAMWAESARNPAPVNEEWASVVPLLTGRPARTFAEWATDHAADFQWAQGTAADAAAVSAGAQVREVTAASASSTGPTVGRRDDRPRPAVRPAPGPARRRTPVRQDMVSPARMLHIGWSRAESAVNDAAPSTAIC
jgi:hypothetical protein